MRHKHKYVFLFFTFSHSGTVKLISLNIMFFYVMPAEILEGIRRKLKKKHTRTHNKNKELKESVNGFLGFGIIFSYISCLITVSTIFMHVYTVFYLNNIW